MPTPDPVAATTRCPWCGYEPADEEHECSRFSETEPPADSSAAIAQRLPDEMGIWTDGGDIVWLPTRYYPSRRGAFRFARDEWQATPRDVFVTHAWMRFDPAGDEDRWSECEGDDPGAFACWRIEAA